jgi:hypothetical protein
MINFLKGFVVISLLVGLLYLTGIAPFVGIFALICLLAIPLALVQSYRSSINTSIRALAFSPSGIIAGFLGRKSLKNVFYSFAAFILALSLLINLASLVFHEWIYVILAWPVFLIVFAVIRKIIKKELPDWLLNPYSLLGALRIAPFIMILVYFLGLWYGGDIIVYLTAQEALSFQILPFNETNSFFLNRLSHLIMVLEGYRNFAFGAIFKLNPWAWFFLTFIISWTFFYSLSSLFVFILIPKGELKRAWARPLRDGKVDPPSFKRALVQVIVPILLVFVGFFYLAVKVELFSMMSREAIAQEICTQTHNFRVQIGDELFNGEIVEAAIKHRSEFQKLSKDNKKKLIDEINSIFNGYKNNVDSYLDWYYSLNADYARIGTMLVGEAEGFMSDSLTTILAKDVNQEGITKTLRELNQILDKEKQSFEKLKNLYRAPCGINTLSLLETPKVQMKFSDYQFNQLTIPPEVFNLKIRLAISGTLGLTGGVIAGIGVKRVVSKIVKNIFFKSAARTLVGVATKKTASVVGAGVIGGATGAAIGSGVAVGPGTAAGAVLGFGTGVLGALVTDYLLLKLEEVISRENFRVSLISMLEIQRKELIAALDNETPPTDF